MEDRRMFARFDVDFPVEYRMAGMGECAVASCQDVSATGVGVVMSERVTLSTIMDLVLKFPDAGTFSGLARVIWSKKIYEGKWRTGIELINVDLMKIRKILSFAKV